MRRRSHEDLRTTSGRIRGSTPTLQEVARDLRKRMTPAEQVLWQERRGQRLASLHFRRQHPVGPFVLDFACPKRLLAIELDGGVHLDLAEQDAARTATLEDYGWCVVRFVNEAIFTELSTVLSAIESAALSRPVARGWNARPTPRGNEKPLP